MSQFWVFCDQESCTSNNFSSVSSTEICIPPIKSFQFLNSSITLILIWGLGLLHNRFWVSLFNRVVFYFVFCIFIYTYSTCEIQCNTNSRYFEKLFCAEKKILNVNRFFYTGINDEQELVQTRPINSSSPKLWKKQLAVKNLTFHHLHYAEFVEFTKG